MDRRSFLTGMAIMIAAPYVVKTSGLLMPIRDRRPKLDELMQELSNV